MTRLLREHLESRLFAIAWMAEFVLQANWLGLSFIKH